MTAELRELFYRTLSLPPLIEWRCKALADGRSLTILNFHKVSDDTLDRFEAITPMVFDRLIGWLKKRFQIVSFAELRTLRPVSKPVLIISFDDGYRDFIDSAAPILRKHGVSANMNIIPACVESGQPPFNIILKDFIFQAPDTLLRETPLPGLPQGANPNKRVASSLVASAALKNQPIEDQKVAWAYIWPRLARFDDLKITQLMSTKHILQVCDEFEIGAHSFEHATMNLESESYFRSDLERCKAWCRNLTGGGELDIYAFPNGNATMQQVQFALKYGFAHVLFVGETVSTVDTCVHPRITMRGRDFHETIVRAVGHPTFWKSNNTLQVP